MNNFELSKADYSSKYSRNGTNEKTLAKDINLNYLKVLIHKGD